MERIVSFQLKSELEQALAQQLHSDLKKALLTKGKASLLLSGGTTPSGVYELLSKQALDWQHVTVGLVDERFVDQSSPFSNETLIRKSLLQNNAALATLVPMVYEPSNEQLNLAQTNAAYQAFRNADACLLGMGPDGHTASLFPNDPATDLALIGTEACYCTNAPTTPTQRITCSRDLLVSVQHVYLMITGQEKLDVLAASQQQQLPIAIFNPIIERIYFCQ
ncbi:MAG: 6-phosphogluconolactonase [Bacteroidota bacterium]|jgi:6-phosphogluconolactonase